MPRLPSVGGDSNIWGSILNEYLQVGHNSDGSHSFGRVVTEHGATPTGLVDAGADINAAIQASSPGEAILFPGGTYRLEETVLVKADRAYIALGDVTFKQKDNTELDAMVAVDPGETYPRRNIHWQGISLDGNRANNVEYTSGSGYAKNKGMVLNGVQFSNFVDFAVRNCGNDGLVFTGHSSTFDETSSTNHFVSPYIYNCGRYGAVFDAYSDDNHLFDGDVGYCDFGSVAFLAGSSSLRACTLWGTKFSHGITVAASSNQVLDCQIEGHNQHGVFVTEFGDSFLLSGCKIYYNGLGASNTYDGVYVQGTATHPVDAFTAIGNYIHQGLDAFNPTPDVRYRHAITLDTNHTNAVLEANSVARIGLSSAPDTTSVLVYGLRNGDVFNGRRWCTAATEPANLGPGEIAFQTDTGNLRYHTGPARARVERILTSVHDTDGGNFATVTAGLTSFAVAFTDDRGDTAYTPWAAPNWNTTWSITDKASTGFTINVGTAAPAGAACDWGLIRQ